MAKRINKGHCIEDECVIIKSQLHLPPEAPVPTLRWPGVLLGSRADHITENDRASIKIAAYLEATLT